MGVGGAVVWVWEGQLCGCGRGSCVGVGGTVVWVGVGGAIVWVWEWQLCVMECVEGTLIGPCVTFIHGHHLCSVGSWLCF